MNYRTPTFLIVGAVKAGTTSLHEYLQMHPEIFMSPIKETNFFSDADMLFEHFNVDYKQDVSLNVEKYLKGPMDKKVHIAHVRSWDDYQKLFRDVKNEKAIGEVSNSYLFLPSAPASIKNKLPEAKIIMVLRDPVERLYSQYLMNLKLGKITEKDLLKEIRADQEKRIKGWGVSHLYLEVGKYYEQVKRYFDTFPAAQIKIILFDDFKKDAPAVMKDIFQFLNVDPDFQIDLSKKYNEAGMPRFGKLNYWLTQTGVQGLVKKMFPDKLKNKIKSIIYTKTNIPSITAEERKYLKDYYQDDNIKLSKLINRDLSKWLG
ncbi:MAG: sulfotransferase family protein [Chitinophagales bacterium]